MRKNIYIALAAATLLASCQKNEEEMGGSQRVAARFTEAAITRATGTAWEADDAIGIYMTASTNTIGSLTDDNIVGGAKNIRHTVAAAGATATFTPADAAQQIYFPGNGKTVNFYAYYPHQEGIVDGIYKIYLSDQTKPAAIDLMIAHANGLDGSTAAVTLAFKHRLSKLSFTLTAGTLLTPADLEGMTVTVKGMDVKADYVIGQDRLYSSDITAIVAKTAADGTSAEAIVMPNRFERGKVTLVFRLTNGIEAEWKLPPPVVDPNNPNLGELLGGKNYHHTLRINRANVDVVAKNISDWVPGNGPGGESGEIDNLASGLYSVGDYYPDPDVVFSAPGVVASGLKPLGIVCWLDDTAPGHIPADELIGTVARGFDGCIVSLDETTLAWGPTGVRTGATDLVDGSFNMGKIENLPDWETAYPAFLWCHAKNSGGRTWYLPAARQIAPLATKFIAGKEDMNRKFTAAGGDSLEHEQYWTSSEVNDTDDPGGNTAQYVSFKFGDINGGPKQVTQGVRAVSPFHKQTMHN